MYQFLIYKIAVEWWLKELIWQPRDEKADQRLFAMVRCAIHWPQQTFQPFTPTASPRVFFLAFFFHEHFSWCFSFFQGQLFRSNFTTQYFLKTEIFERERPLCIATVSTLEPSISHAKRNWQRRCRLSAFYLYIYLFVRLFFIWYYFKITMYKTIYLVVNI